MTSSPVCRSISPNGNLTGVDERIPQNGMPHYARRETDADFFFYAVIALVNGVLAINGFYINQYKYLKSALQF